MAKRTYQEIDRIDEELPRLSRRQRTAFATACAERVLPVFERYRPDDDYCRRALTMAWRFVENEALDAEEVDELSDEGEELVDQLHAQDETGATLRAANAAIFALGSVRQKESTLAAEAATEASSAAFHDDIDHADDYAQEEAEWQMRALDLAITVAAPTRSTFVALIADEPEWLRALRKAESESPAALE